LKGAVVYYLARNLTQREGYEKFLTIEPINWVTIENKSNIKLFLYHLLEKENYSPKNVIFVKTIIMGDWTRIRLGSFHISFSQLLPKRILSFRTPFISSF
jgi:hypothetical protein